MSPFQKFPEFNQMFVRLKIRFMAIAIAWLCLFAIAPPVAYAQDENITPEVNSIQPY